MLSADPQCRAAPAFCVLLRQRKRLQHGPPAQSREVGDGRIRNRTCPNSSDRCVASRLLLIAATTNKKRRYVAMEFDRLTRLDSHVAFLLGVKAERIRSMGLPKVRRRRRGCAGHVRQSPGRTSRFRLRQHMGMVPFGLRDATYAFSLRGRCRAGSSSSSSSGLYENGENAKTAQTLCLLSLSSI